MHQSNQRPAGTGNRASVYQRLAGTGSLGCLLRADARHNISCCQSTSGQPELKILHQSNQRPAGTGNLASVNQRPARTGSLGCLLLADTRLNRSCVSQPAASWNCQSTSGQLELVILRQTTRGHLGLAVRVRARTGGPGPHAANRII